MLRDNSIMDHPGIEWELVSYYQDLLMEPIQTISKAIEKITQHIPPL
jgi:hypothetical protein